MALLDLFNQELRRAQQERENRDNLQDQQLGRAQQERQNRDNFQDVQLGRNMVLLNAMRANVHQQRMAQVQTLANRELLFEQPPGIPGINAGPRLLLLPMRMVQVGPAGPNDNFFPPDQYYLQAISYNEADGARTFIRIEVRDESGVPLGMRTYHYFAKHLISYVDWDRLDDEVQRQILDANMVYRYRG